ncbi:low-density lipoprotein receptor 2-like [Argopecten irradians]|uniref:low-density lipoprotein receptor 2-like n=1 Tax=Argopecten irradians TaxID=31199 RepID=UPI0037117A39
MVKSSTEEDWEGMVEEAKSTPSSDRDMTHRVACVVLDECCPTEEQDEVLVELSKLAPQSLNVDSTLRLSFVLLHRLVKYGKFPLKRDLTKEDAEIVKLMKDLIDSIRAMCGQPLTFFTSGHEVRQVIPDKKAYSGTLSWGRHMGALDVDVDRRLLYFSGLSLMKIERAGIPDDIKNGGPPRPQDLNADVTQVEGIAIDWVTKNIYWTDSSRRTISVALDDGRYQKTLIRDDLVHPLAIIVNPKLGPRQSRQFGCIWRLTILGFPTDGRRLMNMDKFGYGVNVTLQTRLLLPSSVRIMHPKRHNLSGTASPCQIYNGGCVHSCHPAPDGKAECQCSDIGLTLGEDGKSCVPLNHTCGTENFVCVSAAVSVITGCVTQTRIVKMGQTKTRTCVVPLDRPSAPQISTYVPILNVLMLQKCVMP